MITISSIRCMCNMVFCSFTPCVTKIERLNLTLKPLQLLKHEETEILIILILYTTKTFNKYHNYYYYKKNYVIIE